MLSRECWCVQYYRKARCLALHRTNPDIFKEDDTAEVDSMSLYPVEVNFSTTIYVKQESSKLLQDAVLAAGLHVYGHNQEKFREVLYYVR